MVKMKKFRGNLYEGILLCSILLAAFVVYYNHWKFELPLHPNVDENITVYAVRNLVKGDKCLLIKNFNYPHIAFYWGALWCKIVSFFKDAFDMVLVLRVVECGFALFTNICIYALIKDVTGSKRWGFIGLLIALFSLYQAQYLYYAGPDAMLYGVANIIFYLGIKIYKEEDIKKVFHRWYPVMAVCIGLAASAKYHGIFLGFYWLIIHVMKKYYKKLQFNLQFVFSCFLIVVTWIVCDFSILVYGKEFIAGIIFNGQHYLQSEIPPLVHTCPFLGYLEVFVLHTYGFWGLFLLLVGVVYLLKKKSYRQFAVPYLAVVILVICVLGKFKLMLGRNLSLIMPCAQIFIVFGLYALEQFISLKYCKFVINVMVFIMVSLNIAALVVTENYSESYQAAEKWIEDNVSEGAAIYLTGYAPFIDNGKYTVVMLDFNDYVNLQEKLGDNDYFISIEYADMRYIQKKDYPILFGNEYVMPQWADTYFKTINKMTKIAQFPGITYEHGWRYRIGYMDGFSYPSSNYFIGPTIEIYENK